MLNKSINFAETEKHSDDFLDFCIAYLIYILNFCTEMHSKCSEIECLFTLVLLAHIVQEEDEILFFTRKIQLLYIMVCFMYN